MSDSYQNPGVPWYADPRTPRPIPPHLMEESPFDIYGGGDAKLARLTARRNRLMAMRDAVKSAWADGDKFRLVFNEQLPARIRETFASGFSHQNRLGIFRGIRSRNDGSWDVIPEWVDPPTNKATSYPPIYLFFWLAVREPEIETIKPKPRGHWTSGKRRNDPGPDWPATLDALRRCMSHPVPGVVSCRAMAEVIGVDDRNVRKYLSGEFLPTPDTAAAIASWLKRVNTDRRDTPRRKEKPGTLVGAGRGIGWKGTAAECGMEK